MAEERWPAVFLDRDGTLMEEVEYCSRPEDVRVFPGAAEALEALRAGGFRLVMVSNQSGIGRGLFTRREYEAVQREFERRLGVALDGAYMCPDGPGAPSECRKPATGMVERAARELNLDVGRSFFVGDKASDVECGRAAGMRTVLVLTGYGRLQACEADFVANNVTEAARWILEGHDEDYNRRAVR